MHSHRTQCRSNPLHHRPIISCPIRARPPLTGDPTTAINQTQPCAPMIQPGTSRAALAPTAKQLSSPLRKTNLPLARSLHQHSGPYITPPWCRTPPAQALPRPMQTRSQKPMPSYAEIVHSPPRRGTTSPRPVIVQLTQSPPTDTEPGPTGISLSLTSAPGPFAYPLLDPPPLTTDVVAAPAAPGAPPPPSLAVQAIQGTAAPPPEAEPTPVPTQATEDRPVAPPTNAAEPAPIPKGKTGKRANKKGKAAAKIAPTAPATSAEQPQSTPDPKPATLTIADAGHPRRGTTTAQGDPPLLNKTAPAPGPPTAGVVLMPSRPEASTLRTPAQAPVFAQPQIPASHTEASTDLTLPSLTDTYQLQPAPIPSTPRPRRARSATTAGDSRARWTSQATTQALAPTRAPQDSVPLAAHPPATAYTAPDPVRVPTHSRVHVDTPYPREYLPRVSQTIDLVPPNLRARSRQARAHDPDTFYDPSFASPISAHDALGDTEAPPEKRSLSSSESDPASPLRELRFRKKRRQGELANTDSPGPLQFFPHQTTGPGLARTAAPPAPKPMS